jgi:hypothetical protein
MPCSPRFSSQFIKLNFKGHCQEIFHPFTNLRFLRCHWSSGNDVAAEIESLYDSCMSKGYQISKQNIWKVYSWSDAWNHCKKN